jgi:hypothetical protein
LFDSFGAGFTLLRLAGSTSTSVSASVDALVAAAGPVPLAVVDVPGDVGRDLYGADLALIRPDQHVAWRGNAVPDDAAGLLATVAGG